MEGSMAASALAADNAGHISTTIALKLPALWHEKSCPGSLACLETNASICMSFSKPFKLR